MKFFDKKAVVSTVIGVVLAGLILRFSGNVPILEDASRGFDGARKNVL